MHKKIAFIGAVGSGKTTLIQQLTQIHTANTDVESSEQISKKMTTVGIDYGQINMDESTSFGLYGVPGQQTPSFIWDFIKTGLWATVILIKNNNQSAVTELSYLLDYFEISSKSLCLIAITHADISQGDTTFDKIQKILNKRKLVLPVYSIDSRTAKSSELIIKTLTAIEEQKS